MTYSQKGIGGASRNMHSFVRSCILPKEKTKCRPVVLNSWEAFYFNIDEKIMLDFADGALEAGMDTVVMDDGWFGDKYQRLSDNSSLGDWVVDRKKLPNGISWLVKQADSHGIRFVRLLRTSS